MKYRILWFDKDENIRKVFEDILKDEGFLVDSTGNGREALAMICEAVNINKPYDLVIAHVFSNREKTYDPNFIDGEWLIEEMIKRGIYPKIPVIITLSLKGRGLADKVEDYYFARYKVAGLVTRPINSEKLFQKIATVLLIKECGLV